MKKILKFIFCFLDSIKILDLEIVFTVQILTITICFNLVRNFVLDPHQFSTIELFINQAFTLWKKLVWKLLQYLQENTCVGVSLFWNIHKKIPVLKSVSKELQARRAAILLNRYSNTGVFLWICKTLKNTYFEVHLQIIASGMLLECYFFHTKTDFLFVQEDSFALTGVFL